MHIVNHKAKKKKKRGMATPYKMQRNISSQPHKISKFNNIITSVKENQLLDAQLFLARLSENLVECSLKYFELTESNSSFQNLMAHKMKGNHIPIYLTFLHSFLLTDESSQMNGKEGKERS